MTLPPWRPLLRSALQREGRTPAARWLQLATTAADGTPRVRTLVFRGWDAHSRMLLYTDGRSSKTAELTHQPAVETCWLLPKAKQQYRFRGAIELCSIAQDPDHCRNHWKQLSPGGRALWAWPEPGQPFNAGVEYPVEIEETTPPPQHFWVLTLTIERVELLDLGHHPHRRLTWSLAQRWAEQRLNP